MAMMMTACNHYAANGLASTTHHLEINSLTRSYEGDAVVHADYSMTTTITTTTK